MPAPLTETDVAFYHTHGYFVFRQIVPATLITDLRRTAQQALAVARRINGPQAQRLQGLDQHAEVDIGPVRTFAELPELNAGIRTLLTPRHRISEGAAVSFLFEPAEQCWATPWHRDWRDHMSAAKFLEVFEGRWETTAADLNFFNQINCALYEDPSTWYVPGSHRRLQDTPEETRAAQSAELAAVENRDRRRAEVEQELFLHDYCARMPGAVQLRLQPGDLAIYRSIAWHIGSYVPYRRRATLHCSATTAEFEQFWRRTKAIMEKQ